MLFHTCKAHKVFTPDQIKVINAALDLFERDRKKVLPQKNVPNWKARLDYILTGIRDKLNES